MPSPTESTVTRLGVEELPPLPSIPRKTAQPEPPKLVTAPPTVKFQPVHETPDEMSSVLVVLRAAGYALSARVLLLLAIVGAFILAVMTMRAGVLPYVLVAYCLLVVLPVVVLEIRRRAG